MNALTLHRCLHHPEREAVARCPECGQFYCRECVTEHDDRMLCASCIAKLTAEKSAAPPSAGWMSLVTGAFLGWLAAWLIFYCVGRALLALPASLHQNSVWNTPEETR